MTSLTKQQQELVAQNLPVVHWVICDYIPVSYTHLAGMARPFHALDEMGYIIGGFDGLLPYGKEIDRCATEGGMFQAIKYCNPKYTASLNKVLDALEQMELAEQVAEEADDEDEFEEDDADE